MKVLLIGNYEFDGSTSMKIWAGALQRELQQRGVEVCLLFPTPVLGRLKGSAEGVGKWLGYIDRFLIFPWKLRQQAARADIVHLCDHGSAMYAPMVKRTPVVVTCNDMLAVRGALGEVPDCPASFFGRILQQWICHGLKRATRVACISRATFDDARRILGADKNLCVILDGLNYPFQPVAEDEAARRLAALPEVREPFILHVGSSLARKNREGVLRVFAQAAQGTALRMVFAGTPLRPEQMQLAKDLKIFDRVVQVVAPGVAVIEALYSRAVALVFPSRFEGFGWPPIEAQACGCPVVGSDIPPVAEVLGDSAAVKSLADEAGMAEAVRRLLHDPAYREQMRQRGFVNVRERFQTSRMIDEYIALYRELA